MPTQRKSKNAGLAMQGNSALSKVAKKKWMRSGDLADILEREEKLLAYAVAEFEKELGSAEFNAAWVQKHKAMAQSLATLTEARIKLERHHKSLGEDMTPEEAVDALEEFTIRKLDRRVAKRLVIRLFRRLGITEEDINEVDRVSE